MVNGYVTLDLASNKIYKEALGAIKSGKPVMVVDAPNVYFADTIKTATIDDDVVVEITKGGKTITINDANAVSSEGFVENALLENIKDKSGNLRFIEGSGTLTALPEGATNIYNKWSLSGTHLMLVATFDIANGTELTQDSITITYDSLPKWILDKITVLWGTSLVDQKTFVMNNPNTSGANVDVQLRKEDENTLVIKQRGTSTLSVDRSVRFQFDLLIDAE